MKCAECNRNGDKSLVYPGMSVSTCMGWLPYFDESGDYHNHNPNSVSSEYSCSKGHKWAVSEAVPCPSLSCDYGKRA